MTTFRPIGLALFALAVSAPTAVAQEPRRSLDIGINKVGLSIGDSREWTGVRLNFRDRYLERVTGVNATIWTVREGGVGEVTGIALGLPRTGGRNVTGIAVAAFGAGATQRFTGIGVGGLGIGAGQEMRGAAIGGLGVGSGGNVTGLAIGGLGAGAGGSVRGIVLGGLGAGAGSRFDGIGIGGLGVGAGEGGSGIVIGGLGAGFGGDFTGIGIGGLGVGAGGHARGVFIGGLGVGAGGSVGYLSIGAVGVGSPHVKGLAIGGVGVGGQRLEGVMVGGALVQVDTGGVVRGASVAAFNRFRGHQQGVAIGLVNYAWSLNGVQLGVINIVRDNPRGRRVLPIINWGR
jgi:hypothetical protein